MLLSHSQLWSINQSCLKCCLSCSTPPPWLLDVYKLLSTNFRCRFMTSAAAASTKIWRVQVCQSLCLTVWTTDGGDTFARCVSVSTASSSCTQRARRSRPHDRSTCGSVSVNKRLGLLPTPHTYTHMHVHVSLRRTFAAACSGRVRRFSLTAAREGVRQPQATFFLEASGFYLGVWNYVFLLLLLFFHVFIFKREELLKHIHIYI